MTTEAITLDPATHEYRTAGGRKLPGCTHILKCAGLIESDWFSEEAKQRGTAIHLLTQYYDLGILDSDQPAWLIPYFNAYEAFLRDANPVIRSIEEPVHCEAYGFAGTLDRRVTLNGSDAIIDLKSGASAKWHPIQTAGYALCFDRPMKRFSLYLHENGRYSLVEHSNRRDRDVFLAALTVCKFLEQ